MVIKLSDERSMVKRTFVASLVTSISHQ